MRVARGTMKYAHVIVLALLLGSGWAVLENRNSALASRPVEGARDVTCTYLAQIKHLPPDARMVQVWVPVAKTGREQHILRRDVRAAVAYTIAQDPDYHNDILHVALEPPIPDHLEIAVDYRAQLLGGNATLGDFPPAVDELQRDLQPNALVIIDDEVRARAKQATTGRVTLIARARGIYDHVRAFMAYDKAVPGWGRGDTRRACVLGKGNCTDFHSLFISMARAEHIPARFKIGVVIPHGSSGTIPGYHCWAEFYIRGRGWVPVDASEAWKHPELADYYFGTREPSRFLLSTGRDIQLVPTQHGDPVNIFFVPYVEVNGQAFSDVGVEVRFADLQHGRTT